MLELNAVSSITIHSQQITVISSTSFKISCLLFLFLALFIIYTTIGSCSIPKWQAINHKLTNLLKLTCDRNARQLLEARIDHWKT